MKNVAIALTAVAGLAGAANAQVFEMVITSTGSLGGNYAPGELVTYSLYMDNDQGGGFTDFVGWSSFSGFTSANGDHIAPDEASVTDQTGAWEGRRPPAFPGPPGGTSGGFRFVVQNYTLIPDGLAGQNAGAAYEGLAASAPLGGFNWQDDPRLEVFRGSFNARDAGTHMLTFNPIDAAYFNTASHDTTVIGVASQMGNVGASYTVIPAPASLALLGLGGLAVRRRR